MRTIIALAVIGVSLALGGCFHHHTQTIYTADVPPPPVVTPLK